MTGEGILGDGAPSEDLARRLQRYLEITTRALTLVRVAPPERSFLHRGGQDMLDMARTYLEDARHFRARGDLARALAAVSYAHGWIDAGVRLGLLDGGDNDEIFTQFS
jgi:hypothetical protein